jgi:predicted ATPase/class 3 adenylate cyclase/DNA-binding winged helix-turn-helix (wHTH) protein
MDFRILGSLQVVDDERVIVLGGSKQRALLGVLLVHANETLSTDRLIDELWGEQPPATAAKTVQVHVSRLRKALAAAAGDGAEELVVTREHGYELALDPERLDAHRFERLVAEGRASLADGEPRRAVSALEAALAMWRGQPLDDLAYERFAQREIARLEDLHVAALEELIDAKLALGGHGEVVGRLEGLIADHPYRERLRAQLMLALYRCERQADALQAYQDARRVLVEELGIEPGARLRELEGSILAQEPALALPAAEDDAGETPSPAPPAHELPTGVVTFLLTDIEGSSRLWEADPRAMAAALERHDGLIADTAEAHGGRLLKAKGEGDSTLTVYRRASDAVAAAVALQDALPADSGSGEPVLRVRIALHTGEAHERDSDYFGPALNRASRLRGLAHGGETVLSQATTEIVQDGLPAGVELVDLGRQELPGLSRPEHVFELRREGTADETSERAATRTRKTVTVVFATFVDRAPYPPELDPEVRGRIIARCFDEMRAVLEMHGGTVETYPGDALMAIFGVPLLHEDDAVRAVRAATEMRDALAALGDELEDDFGLRLDARVGVGTGEVIADHPPGGSTLASGEAVNLAKRLEEVATASETLIDEKTHRLARAFVRAGPPEPRSSRGGEPIVALALGELRSASVARPSRLESPLVGRDGQLAALSSVFSAAAADRACHLATVLGAAGVGKSRLVQEFIAGLGEGAGVLRGRCLPYGEGITYWPLAELVRDLTGEEEDGPAMAAAVRRHLTDDPKADSVVAGVAEALGVSDSAVSAGEKIFWAVRRLFEALARPRPLVVVLDDLQWAEPTFLDLVEYVADLSRDAPLVLLCMARPELLDARPGWSGGKLNATSILLEPLATGESSQLIANLLSRAAVPPALGTRIADATEGNPLFAEELLGELIDDGLLRPEENRWVAAEQLVDLPVPPTIHALLAARLERLPDDERALLARASVEGAVFHSGAVDALAPAALAPGVDRSLTSLVRRDVIRPDRSSFPEQDAFRFRHALIRDAAYRSVAKETRAQLHVRFADWVEQTAGSRLGAFEEIVGYHLERAHQLWADLGLAGAEEPAVAARAAEHLESAGRRALARGDRAGAVNLLERAAGLHVDGERLAGLLPDLGAALIEAGRLADAERVLAEGAAAAADAGDEGASAHVLVEGQFLGLQRGALGGTAEATEVVAQVTPVFSEKGDEYGLCRALRLSAWVHWIQAQTEAAAGDWEHAAEHARRAGAEHERVEILGWVASSRFFGPTPVEDGIRRCESIRHEVGGHPAAVADVLQPLAGLHAMAGRFERARELLTESEAIFEEHGLGLNSAVSHHAAMVELLAGDAEAAERSLRAGVEVLEEMGDRALVSTTAAFLGQALLAQGRTGEAEQFAALSEELTAADDLITQVLWRGVRARTLAARDRREEAVRLAREAVALAERSDFVNHRGDALMDLGIVLRLAGRAEEARDAVAEALGLFELKGNAVAAGRAKAELAKPARV